VSASLSSRVQKHERGVNRFSSSVTRHFRPRFRLEREVLPIFTGRVLSFDLDASQAYAQLMARAKEAGKAIGETDGYIAATAAARGLMVATRDTSPFEAAGLNVINPWNTSQ
jgi:predicted nucleic acid-binding protein